MNLKKIAILLFILLVSVPLDSMAIRVDDIPIREYGLMLITYVCTNSYVYGYNEALSLSDCRGEGVVNYVAYAVENSIIDVQKNGKKILLEIAYYCCTTGRKDVLTGKNSYPRLIDKLIEIEKKQRKSQR